MTLDPAMLAAKLAARYRQQFERAAAEQALLVEEIAHLEAYVAQQAARIAELETPPPADAWGDTEPA